MTTLKLRNRSEIRFIDDGGGPLRSASADCITYDVTQKMLRYARIDRRARRRAIVRDVRMRSTKHWKRGFRPWRLMGTYPGYKNVGLTGEVGMIENVRFVEFA